jgi:ABC-type polar amino acid transport system ATPase subunit
MTTRPTVLSARAIEKTLGSVKAVDGVSLDIASHEVVAIIGPSGAGKSTFLRCLNMLEVPDAGTVVLAGDELTSAPRPKLAKLRASMGMVFQSFNLFPHLSAEENVALAPIHVLKVDKDAARDRARVALEQVGLADKCQAYPRHLSGGQQQRVGIARALAMQPMVMLFDEPTSALDAEMVSEVLRVIRDLAADGMTMVLVSHEVGFVREAAHRVVFMDGGRAIEEGPPADFFASPREERSRRFVQKIL